MELLDQTLDIGMQGVLLELQVWSVMDQDLLVHSGPSLGKEIFTVTSKPRAPKANQCFFARMMLDRT